jgi:hypothetical protein
VGPTLFLIFGVRERTAAGLETVISVALCRWHHTADETRPGKFTARGYLVVACLQLNLIYVGYDDDAKIQTLLRSIIKKILPDVNKFKI